MDAIGVGMIKKWTHLVATVLVVVGGILWGAYGIFGVALLGRGVLAKAIYLLVGIAAVIVAVDRASYLPFLGETVMPCSLLSERTPENADVSVEVNGLTPGTKVLYWATEPATEGLARIVDWRRAYLDFANAGVTVVDGAGRAVLRVRRPQPYTVPVMGRLEAHVHWRACGDNGLLGPVRTTPLAM